MNDSDEMIDHKKYGSCVYIVIISTIILLSLLIRFKGIWFGYPLMVHPDEGVIVSSSLNILKSHNLHPIRFDYPSLNIYLDAIVYYLFISAKQIAGYTVESIKTIEYYLVGRTVTVLLSVGTVYIVYLMGRLLFNEIIGVLAAFFICTANLHIANSYMITVDNSVAFWTSMSTLMAIKIYKCDRERKYYLLSGMFAGFAMGCKYTAFLAVLPMVVAHIYRVKEMHPKQWINANIVFGVIVVPIVFIITTPYAILDYENFINTMGNLRLQYTSGHAGAESSGNSSLFLYLNSLYKEGYGILPTIFACIGLIYLFATDSWKAIIIFIFPCALVLYVGQYKTFFLRNIVAVIPCLALLTSVAVYNLSEVITQKISNKRNCNMLVLIILIITVCVSSVATIKSMNELNRVTLLDTRWVATEWILTNITTKERVAREWYTPPIEQYSTNYLVTDIGCGKVVMAGANAILANQDYVILSSNVYDRFVNYPKQYPEMAVGYNKFFKEHELVKEFLPDWKLTGGPTIKIFKIR